MSDKSERTEFDQWWWRDGGRHVPRGMVGSGVTAIARQAWEAAREARPVSKVRAGTTDRDRHHTATPEDEQRTVRDLLNLIPPCEDCGGRRCLPWLREWTRYFATLAHAGSNTPGLPVALITNLKHDKPRPNDVPPVTLADTVYKY